MVVPDKKQESTKKKKKALRVDVTAERTVVRVTRKEK